MPRSDSRSSTCRSDRGKRTYIITARRITSGEVLKYRNGFFIQGRYKIRFSSSIRILLTIPKYHLLIIDELGFVPLSKTGAELLFEVFSQRYERGSILVTSNLPFDEWTEIFGSERLTGALLDRLTHHVHILEMNGESYRLNQSQKRRKSPKIPA